MKMATLKGEYKECVYFDSLSFGEVWLIVGFFFVGGLTLAVIAISFARPSDFHKSHWDSKNG